MDWQEIFMKYILPAIAVGLSTLFSLVMSKANEWLKRQNKSSFHAVAASIALDAVSAVFPDAILMLTNDGKIDADEKKKLLAKARGIAEPRLKELTGFAQERLHKWLDDELEVAWGKLFTGLGLSSRVDTDLDPDPTTDLDNTPAS